MNVSDEIKKLKKQITSILGAISGLQDGAETGGELPYFAHHTSAIDLALTDAQAQLAALHTDGSPTFANLSIPGLTTDSSAKFGSFEIQSYSVNNSWLGENIYYNGGFIRRATGYGGMIYFFLSEVQIRMLDTGLAGTGGSSYVRAKFLWNKSIGLGGNILETEGLTGAYLVIDANGKVGINDIVPGEYLDVNGNINVTGAYKVNDITFFDGSALIIPNGGTVGQAAGPLLTFDDTLNLLKISGGHVLVNTTETSNLGYWQIASLNPKTGDAPFIHLRSNEALASNPFEARISQVGNATASKQALQFQVGHYGADFSANILLNPAGGNVGIGDPDPAEKLDIGGNINVTGLYRVDDIQVVSNRVVDSDFGITPDSGDADTDTLIDKIRDALVTHGLIATS